MRRNFLALLFGLLCSLTIMCAATPAAAEIYNQEVANATNLIRTTYHIADGEDRRMSAGWPPDDGNHPAFVTPIITEATPSIWQSMRARLEALEKAGVTDSAMRVEMATAPTFVFPKGPITTTPAAAPAATPRPAAAPPAAKAPAPAASVWAPAPETDTPAAQASTYGADRTIFTPIEQAAESTWFWLAKGGWVWILGGVVLIPVLCFLVMLAWSRIHYESFADAFPKLVGTEPEKSEVSQQPVRDEATELTVRKDEQQVEPEALAPSVERAEPEPPPSEPSDTELSDLTVETAAALVDARNLLAIPATADEPPPERARDHSANARSWMAEDPEMFSPGMREDGINATDRELVRASASRRIRRGRDEVSPRAPRFGTGGPH